MIMTTRTRARSVRMDGARQARCGVGMVCELLSLSCEKKTTATKGSEKKKGQEVEFGNPLADSEEDEGGKKTETKKGKGK